MIWHFNYEFIKPDANQLALNFSSSTFTNISSTHLSTYISIGATDFFTFYMPTMSAQTFTLSKLEFMSSTMTTVPFHLYPNNSMVTVSDIKVTSCTFRDFIKIQAASSLSANSLSFTSVTNQAAVDLTKALIHINKV
jgi:hypothetical protein